MRHPGIEPGAPRWQRGILPLNQWRFRCKNKNGVRSGIRTHAPEETGALNQRLRPLGHPNTTLCKSDSVGHTLNKIGNVSKKSGLPGWTRTTDLGIAAEHFHLQSPALPTELPRGCHVCWGISSIGRVRRSQRRGTGIETRILHFCQQQSLIV